jgi:hypothetical protein
MKDAFLPTTHKFLPASEVLKNFKSSKGVGPSLAEIEKKIAKLEKEAAVALAIETFLDCDYEKVKVSKRVPKSRKYSLGYVH